jgi:pimeloyl-ACP methyl ester carboxylesterase
VVEVTVRHPELVRKLILAAPSYNKSGFYPEVYANIEKLKPEDFAGSPWLEAYKKTVPNPQQWPALVGKIRHISREFVGWPPETIQSIKAPALVVIGDSDVVRPEHAVELFRLLGGGVPGDLVGLPRSQLAVLPGSTHVTLVDRADWLVSMITSFLDQPTSQAGTPMPGTPSKGKDGK